jgi:hypothetical protein
MFSGSYTLDDVVFLLKPIQIAPTPVAEKERLIQTGRRHYSEMISAEQPPSPAYLRVFHQALEQNKARLARDLIVLSRQIAAARRGPITLVSLARAGTPIGVLLTRTLRRHLQRAVTHYSISLIRDRGIDTRALHYILERHEADSVVFVDGWTGKGVIAAELERAVEVCNKEYGTTVDAGLHVVADLSGTAAVASTDEDYLIPSCVLGCTISGLISRSILNDAVIGPGDFHGCVFYWELAGHDLSAWFVDLMLGEIASHWDATFVAAADPGRKAILREQCTRFLADMARRFHVRNPNYVKPGIGEATRVLLRRVPGRILLRDPEHPELEHLRFLAHEKGVPISAEPALPYLAAAIVKEIND